MNNPYQSPQTQGHPQTQQYGQAAYEFGDSENVVLGSAATWMMVLAVLCLLEAVSNVFNGQFLGAALSIAVGVLLLISSSAFKRVVTTQGDDVPTLMKALDTFSTVLTIRIVLFSIIAILIGGVTALALAH